MRAGAGAAPHGGGHALLPRQPRGRGRGASLDALAAFRRGLGHGALAALRAAPLHRDVERRRALLRGVVGARLGDDARAGAAVGLVGAEPLGPADGNWPEMAECIRILRG